MSRRQSVLGLPIGRPKPSMPFAQAAKLGVAALAAVPLAQRGMRGMRKGHDIVDRAGHAVDAVGQVKDAVSSHSSSVGKATGLIAAVAKMKKGDEGKPKLSHLIEEHTDISVSRPVAYNQWTQMEMFPRITKGIISVNQENDSEAEWASKIGPVTRHWKARITEQIPDERIAWRSQGGPEHEGVVTFHSIDDDLTRVLVQMHYKPQGPFEVVANKLRIQRRRVRRDLRLFKHFLELRGEETGAWRGTLNGDSSQRDQRQGSGGSRAARGSSRARGTRSSGPDGRGAKSRSRGSSGSRSSGSTARSSGAHKSAGGRARSGSRS